MERKEPSKKPPSKGHAFTFDKLTKCMILEILDPESMLPLWVKVRGALPRQLIRTREGKLHLQ